MLCPSFAFFLASLAAVLAPVTAQSCNTTGTYEACCPSSDGKVLIFQGKDYRVRCSYSHVFGGVDSPNRPMSLTSCVQKCSGKTDCLNPQWQSRGQSSTEGLCYVSELKSDAASGRGPGTKNVAFVSLDTSEKAKDPDQCRDEVSKCNTDCDEKIRKALKDKISITDCDRKIEQAGKGKISISDCDRKVYEAGKGKISITDCDRKVYEAGKGKISITDCDRKVREASKGKISNKACNDKITSAIKKNNKKWQEKFEKFKEKKKASEYPRFSCINGLKTIYGHNYDYHCNNDLHTFEKDMSTQTAKVRNDMDCARRCNHETGCKWAYYYPPTRYCWWSKRVPNYWNISANGKGLILKRIA